ncbi:MAG: hypothetical protein ACRDZ3_21740 [Acidimicrobiia bacterium]
MPMFGSALVIVGFVWGVVLPAAVLLAILLEPRLLKPQALWMRRCRRSNPADPTSRPCWVPLGEHCPRHDRIAEAQPLPERRRLIA